MSSAINEEMPRSRCGFLLKEPSRARWQKLAAFRVRSGSGWVLREKKPKAAKIRETCLEDVTDGRLRGSPRSVEFRGAVFLF